jgi:hypothetical protein
MNLSKDTDLLTATRNSWDLENEHVLEATSDSVSNPIIPY